MDPAIPAQSEFKPLLTKKATATFFDVSERTIDRWLLEGVLPAEAKVVLGGSVRFRSSVLIDHIAGVQADHADLQTKVEVSK